MLYTKGICLLCTDHPLYSFNYFSHQRIEDEQMPGDSSILHQAHQIHTKGDFPKMFWIGPKVNKINGWTIQQEFQIM